jgi:hypothetical protein
LFYEKPKFFQNIISIDIFMFIYFFVFMIYLGEKWI